MIFKYFEFVLQLELFVRISNGSNRFLSIHGFLVYQIIFKYIFIRFWRAKRCCEYQFLQFIFIIFVLLYFFWRILWNYCKTS